MQAFKSVVSEEDGYLRLTLSGPVGTKLARTADRRMVFAVIARSELVDYFFETVARDRGASVRVFVNEATALQWLFSR